MKYKAGDRVRIKSIDWYNENKNIQGDIWFDNTVFVEEQSFYCGCELTILSIKYNSYCVVENDYYWTDEMIEGLVEESLLTAPNFKEGFFIHEKDMKCTTEIICPDDYIFKDENGNVINATKIVLEKKEKKYPKIFEECKRIMGIELWNTLWGEDVTEYEEQTEGLIDAIIILKVCRDAYWKIAGEEMGLGKPWEPDWSDNHQKKWTINFYQNEINLTNGPNVHFMLAFPTEEMRDAFYENFKYEIESCKELL